MNIYYYANQVYQFSYARPIYQRLGGTFIVTKFRKLVRFKRYQRNGNAFPEVKTFLNTPPIVVRDTNNMPRTDGIIISQTNTRFICHGGKCITIFMGHGTGDRKYGGNLKNLERYDYHFISGPKHLEKLRDSGVTIAEEQLIKVGNPRFDAYLNGTIDREKCLDDLGIVDRDRKNILYAPTWKRGKGTLRKYVYRFCRELTREFNLIIRPHHFEAKFLPGIKAWAAINRIKHVYFSNSNDLLRHDTMSDFTVSDLLISDTSSIQYEYLITGKPIIIARTDPVDLHSMPDNMDLRSVSDVYDGSPDVDIRGLVTRNLEKQRNREQYQTLLNNCFYFNDGHSTDRAVEFITGLQTS